MEQGSIEWHEERHGIITASRLGDVLAKPGTVRRERYMTELVLDLRGAPCFVDDDDKPWFSHGKEWEPLARTAYEWDTGLEVTTCGLIKRKDIPYFGASPDGLVGRVGGIEIKCRKSIKSHLACDGKVPSEHLPQVNGNILACDAEWWDFVSFYRRDWYNPGEIFVTRVYRDEAEMKRLISAIDQFWNEANDRASRP